MMNLNKIIISSLQVSDQKEMISFNLAIGLLLSIMLATISFLTFKDMSVNGGYSGECWRRNGLCRHLIAAVLRTVVGLGASQVNRIYIFVLMGTQVFSETTEEAIAACAAFFVGGVLSHLYSAQSSKSIGKSKVE